jgi:hypothetical protein
MRHVFVKETQKTATDAVCQCGHLKSEHNDLGIRKFVCPGEGESEMVLLNNGKCPRCPCEKFTWDGWHYGNFNS